MTEKLWICVHIHYITSSLSTCDIMDCKVMKLQMIMTALQNYKVFNNIGNHGLTLAAIAKQENSKVP